MKYGLSVGVLSLHRDVQKRASGLAIPVNEAGREKSES
jgi:hypothetical protein